MAPRTKITKEMIIDASYEIARKEGYEKLTARYIAEHLKCSTQPILYHYASIDEIRREVYKKADRYHSEFIMPAGKYSNPLLEIGMNYVRFGYEEKHLFRFLFQSNQFSGLKMEDLVNSPELTQILAIVSAAAKVDIAVAKEMFLSLFITAHGCASLLVGNAMIYEEERIEKFLISAFRGAKVTEGESL